MGDKKEKEAGTDDDIRLIIVERCEDLSKKLTTSGTRVSKCEECARPVWISKASDFYMRKHSNEKLKIICKPCWDKIDKGDSNVITTEETLKEFDEWYLEHYGYKPTREQVFEMMEYYTGKRPKITK